MFGKLSMSELYKQFIYLKHTKDNEELLRTIQEIDMRVNTKQLMILNILGHYIITASDNPYDIIYLDSNRYTLYSGGSTLPEGFIHFKNTQLHLLMVVIGRHANNNE